MSFASRLFTALIGLALVWFFWPFGGDSEVVKIVEPPSSGHQGRLFTTPLPADSPPKKPNPPSTAQPPPESGPMPAEDGIGGDTVAALPPEPAEDGKQDLKPTRFYRVTVRDGGTLETRGKISITLEGIDFRGADETCKDAKGQDWDCGTQARVALTRFIRGRAVVCRVPKLGKTKAVTARCTLAGTDLSAWMLEQGWAKPAANADAKLAKAADAAREKKAGVWR